MQLKIRSRTAPSATICELKPTGGEIWAKIPQKKIQDITNGLLNLLQEALRARGSNTHYLFRPPVILNKNNTFRKVLFL